MTYETSRPAPSPCPRPRRLPNKIESLEQRVSALEDAARPAVVSLPPGVDFHLSGAPCSANNLTDDEVIHLAYQSEDPLVRRLAEMADPDPSELEEMYDQMHKDKDWTATLNRMSGAMAEHEWWKKRVVGTPLENDLPVIATKIALRQGEPR